MAPTNGLVLAHLARKVLSQEVADKTPKTSEADWLSRRALSFAPNEPMAMYARAEVLEHAGRAPEALSWIERALQGRQEPEYWNMRGRLMSQTNRLEEAYESYSKAIHLAESRAGWPLTALDCYLSNRWQLLIRMDRLAEAEADRFQFQTHVPRRDPRCTSLQIDLTKFFNATFTNDWLMGTDNQNDLSSLPRGLHLLDDVGFDFRGIVQLQGANPQTIYPVEVQDVLVKQRCRALHFLHGTGWGWAPGQSVGEYAIEFVDGKRLILPLLYLQNIRSWWLDHSKEQPLDGATTIAWRGANAHSKRAGQEIALFHWRWTNPRPEVEIKNVRFKSACNSAAPFLLAITAE